MPKVFTSDKQKIGEEGENVASNYLEKQGFVVLERNYTKKWGEIDIVGSKDNKLYFFEVKSTSVAHETIPGGSRETGEYRPEDNMHPWKLRRLSRTIQTYLLEKHVPESMDWQFDVLIVYLNLEKRTATVRREENIIL